MSAHRVVEWLTSFFDWLRDPDGRNRAEYLKMDLKIQRLDKEKLDLAKRLEQESLAVASLRDEKLAAVQEIERLIERLDWELQECLLPVKCRRRWVVAVQAFLGFVVALLVVGGFSLFLLRKREDLPLAGDFYTVVGCVASVISLYAMFYISYRSARKKDKPKVGWKFWRRWNFRFLKDGSWKKWDWLGVLSIVGIAASLLSFCVLILLGTLPEPHCSINGPGLLRLYR